MIYRLLRRIRPPSAERAAAPRPGAERPLDIAPPSAGSHRAPNATVYEPILAHTSERSILQGNLAEYVPFSVLHRPRYATCSGVSWFGGYFLAVVNLYGCHLRIYRFHPDDPVADNPARLELLQETTIGMERPEGVSVSADGKLVAVNSASSADLGVALFDLDGATVKDSTYRIVRSGAMKFSGFHGISFSPNSRYLAVTELTDPGYAEVVDVASLAYERASVVPNRRAPLKPKGVAFSRDGKFAAFSLGINGTSGSQDITDGGSVIIHGFDVVSGVLSPEPVAVYHEEGLFLAGSDMCTFVPTRAGMPYRILVVDQGYDVIRSYEFDAHTLSVVSAGVFADGLSFPHDVDISADGQFVAIANYGDDTLRIGRIIERPV